MENAKEKKTSKVLKAGGGFFKDFKAFISKGNIVQLAVAFIMGAAFTTIVNSLVGDIFMPFFNLIFGGSNIDDLKWVITDNLVINYGKFIFAVLNFLLVAFVLFLIVKLITRAERNIKKKLKKGEVAPTEPVVLPLTTSEQLLTDIKELLLKQEKKEKTKQSE